MLTILPVISSSFRYCTKMFLRFTFTFTGMSSQSSLTASATFLYLRTEVTFRCSRSLWMKWNVYSDCESRRTARASARGMSLNSRVMRSCAFTPTLTTSHSIAAKKKILVVIVTPPPLQIQQIWCRHDPSAAARQTH